MNDIIIDSYINKISLLEKYILDLVNECNSYKEENLQEYKKENLQEINNNIQSFKDDFNNNFRLFKQDIIYELKFHKIKECQCDLYKLDNQELTYKCNFYKTQLDLYKNLEQELLEKETIQPKISLDETIQPEISLNETKDNICETKDNIYETKNNIYEKYLNDNYGDIKNLEQELLEKETIQREISLDETKDNICETKDNIYEKYLIDNYGDMKNCNTFKCITKSGFKSVSKCGLILS
jgi:hypothetical protein